VSIGNRLPEKTPQRNQIEVDGAAGHFGLLTLSQLMADHGGSDPVQPDTPQVLRDPI